MHSIYKDLIIRADASTSIGTGHIMRCIALGQAWQKRGGDVTFLSHYESRDLCQRIVDEGFNCIFIENPHPNPYDLGRTLEILTRFTNHSSAAKTCVAIDGYHFTADYHKAVRENGYRLLVIDDMAHLDRYHADVLLNQNIHAPELNYSCDRETIQLLGADYFMLRQEFLEYRSWKRQIPGEKVRVLVTLGGADPDNVTLKVINALNSVDGADLEANIIVGPENTNTESLEKSLASSPFTIDLSPNVSNMPELMAWADVAISAAGSTCWELAFMRLPFVAIILAKNQEMIAIELDKAGAGMNAGWHNRLTSQDMTLLLRRVLFDRTACSAMIQKGRGLADGQGADRIVEILEQI